MIQFADRRLVNAANAGVEYEMATNVRGVAEAFVRRARHADTLSDRVLLAKASAALKHSTEMRTLRNRAARRTLR